MAWRQKQVDIVHWLQGVQSPSPELLKESDRELTSSSDTTTTPSQPPVITTPISSHPYIADNTVLLSSTARPSLVTESSVCHSVPLSYSAPKNLPHEPSTKGEPSEVKPLQRKSPLPQATLESKLPTFVTFDEDAHLEETLDQPTINMMVNRPPTRPMKPISRASTSPVLSDTNSPPPSHRLLLRPSTMHTLNVDSDLLVSHRKSLSQDDVSQLVPKERRTSTERCCSDPELKKNEEYSPAVSEGGSQSSTGACGLGSDLSDTISNQEDSVSALASSSAMKRKLFKRGVLSAGSVDVLATRLRERMLEMGVQEDEDTSLPLPTQLLSPTSPTVSHQSHLSHSLSPTPPVSPYHTPIVPLSVRSETSHPRPLRPIRDGEGGFSKSRLKQFNLSQQFSFDTTNDEDFSAPSRHPKFLKNNVSVFSQSRIVSHYRSHSDVSSTPSPAHSSIRSGPTMWERKSPNTDSSEIQSQNVRQCKSQLDLSTLPTSPPNMEGTKTLTLFEQLLLKRQQSGGKTVGGRLFRQDSGIGTLSTVSQRF